MLFVMYKRAWSFRKVSIRSQNSLINRVNRLFFLRLWKWLIRYSCSLLLHTLALVSSKQKIWFVCKNNPPGWTFFKHISDRRNCADIYFFLLLIRINVFVIKSSLVIPIIVYLSSIHPPVTEWTYCEKTQKT